jgi:DNA-binding MarR family transcriptional regulator
MRLNELSEHLHIVARSTTEVVDALQEIGFVERRPDPVDRRATLVALTSRGEQAGADIRAARAREGREFFRALSEDDRAELLRILRSVGGSATFPASDPNQRRVNNTEDFS